MASIGSATGSSNRIAFTGMASGMDTESIVNATLAAKKATIIKQEQKQQVAEWKQEMYTELMTKLQNIQDEYMNSLKPASNMRSTANYKIYKSTNTLADGTTSSLVSATGTAEGSAGQHTINVIQSATATTLTSKGTVSRPITSNLFSVISTKVSALTDDQTFSVTLDGTTKKITLTAAELQSAVAGGEDAYAELLEGKMADKFGAGKISVNVPADATKGFTFTTTGGASQLTISDASFMDLSLSTSNTISTSSTLAEAMAKMNTAWDKDAETNEYVIKVNGKEFRFGVDQTIADVVKTVNSNSDAGVNMAYDEVQDKFLFTAKDSGIAGDIVIEGMGDVSTLFTKVQGRDAKAIVDGSLVTRSTNIFTVNGVKYTINREVTPDEALSIANCVEESEVDGNTDTTDIGYDRAISLSSADQAKLIITDETGAEISYIKKSDGTPITASEYWAMSDADKNTIDVRDSSGDSVKWRRLTYTGFVKYKENVDSKVNINLTIDTDAVYEKISKFVETYNEVITTINTKISEKYDSDYDPLTDEEKEVMSEEQIKLYETKAKTGLLRRDNILSTMLSEMRTAMYASIDGVAGGIYSIGITTSTNIDDKGLLVIDETKLKEAIEADPDQVMNIFAKTSDTSFSRTLSPSERAERYKEEGIVQRMYDILQDNISTYRDRNNNPGKLVQKAGMTNTSWATNNALYTEIKNLKTNISDLWDRYYDKEDALYKKYSNLETMMSKLNNQTSSLTSMLG